MLKKFLIGIAVVLVILAAGVWYLSSNLGPIIQAAIEKYGTEATGAPVKVGSVSVSLSSGDMAIRGLTVGNPQGFSSDQALSLGEISIKIDTQSLTGGSPLVVQEFNVVQPQVIYEVNNKGKNNLETIAANTRKYTATFQKKQAPAPQAPAEAVSAQPEQKLIINKLMVRDGKITVKQEMLKDKQLTTNLPDIRLTNLGKGSNGISAAEVAQKLLSSISSSAVQAATSSLTKELGSSLKGLGTSSIEQATDSINNTTTNIQNQMRGLLGQ